MALMEFREPNQVAWYGFRPAHRGTQFSKSSEADNNTVIVHTVTSGKTLFLKLIVLTVRDATGVSFVRVRDGSDVTQYTFGFFHIPSLTGFSPPLVIPFDTPLEIPSGFDIIVVSNTLNHKASCYFHGWEE